MNPSIIVYGVPNGKTRFAERIAKFYGLELVKKEFQGDPGILGYGEIHFTRKKTAPEGFYEPYAKSFREVADEINAGIKPSQWQNGAPTIVGEYDVTVSLRDPFYRRWWHGERWSYAMLNSMTQDEKNQAASTRHDVFWRPFWRGLSEEPIVID